MKSLVLVPTYNERENITPLVTEILQTYPHVHVLVIDDNSPDGTGNVVEGLKAKWTDRIHLLRRAGKEGLGRAYVAGFKWGLAQGYELLIEMDADFSHRVQDLGHLLKTSETHDFVVGSRYVKGGGTVNWGLGRKILSRGGSLYSGCILGFGLRDWTGGFNAWRADVLKTVGVEQIKSDGYAFQIELKHRARKAGFKGIEVPILFEERRVGQSKMSSKIVFEAFYRVWNIRMYV